MKRNKKEEDLATAVLAERWDDAIQSIQGGANPCSPFLADWILHAATVAGADELVKVLIEHGCGPDNLDKTLGVTPLFFLCCWGRPTSNLDVTAKILIEAGANPNWMSPHGGSTCLDAACVADRKDLGRVLTANGATTKSEATKLWIRSLVDQQNVRGIP